MMTLRRRQRREKQLRRGERRTCLQLSSESDFRRVCNILSTVRNLPLRFNAPQLVSADLAAQTVTVDTPRLIYTPLYRRAARDGIDKEALEEIEAQLRSHVAMLWDHGVEYIVRHDGVFLARRTDPHAWVVLLGEIVEAEYDPSARWEASVAWADKKRAELDKIGRMFVPLMAKAISKIGVVQGGVPG